MRNDPPNFQEWVRSITINVFRMAGQPMSQADVQTAVNIVIFFARLIHFGFMLFFMLVYAVLKIHSWLKKIINNHFVLIITLIATCLTLSYISEDIPLMVKTNYVAVVFTFIGNLIITWTHYYMWHLTLMGMTYIAFQIFMAFMRYNPTL